MPDDPSVEQKAEQLARLAADRAAKLALVDADKATELAVARALKDAKVDQVLGQHGEHLIAINGSIAGLHRDLSRMAATFERDTAVRETLATAVQESGARKFTRLQSLGILVTVCVVTGSFILALIATLGHP